MKEVVEGVTIENRSISVAAGERYWQRLIDVHKMTPQQAGEFAQRHWNYAQYRTRDPKEVADSHIREGRS